MQGQKDRRIRVRQSISKEIRYRAAHMAFFEKGLLCDLSHTGALFATHQDIALNTAIQLVIPSEDENNPNAQFIATVVRKNYYETRIRRFEYGCRFDYRHAGERRLTNLTIKYRTSSMNAFEDGLLWNLSRSGALFSTHRDMAEHSPIHLVIPQEDSQQPPLQAIAVILRKELYQMRRRKFGYGCRFNQAIELD